MAASPRSTAWRRGDALPRSSRRPRRASEEQRGGGTRPEGGEVEDPQPPPAAYAGHSVVGYRGPRSAAPASRSCPRRAVGQESAARRGSRRFDTGRGVGGIRRDSPRKPRGQTKWSIDSMRSGRPSGATGIRIASASSMISAVVCLVVHSVTIAVNSARRFIRLGARARWDRRAGRQAVDHREEVAELLGGDRAEPDEPVRRRLDRRSSILRPGVAWRGPSTSAATALRPPIVVTIDSYIDRSTSVPCPLPWRRARPLPRLPRRSSRRSIPRSGRLPAAEAPPAALGWRWIRRGLQNELGGSHSLLGIRAGEPERRDRDDCRAGNPVVQRAEAIEGR